MNSEIMSGYAGEDDWTGATLEGLGSGDAVNPSWERVNPVGLGINLGLGQRTLSSTCLAQLLQFVQGIQPHRTDLPLIHPQSG